MSVRGFLELDILPSIPPQAQALENLHKLFVQINKIHSPKISLTLAYLWLA